MIYLTTRTTHFISGYMVKVTQITKEETCSLHVLGYSHHFIREEYVVVFCCGFLKPSHSREGKRCSTLTVGIVIPVVKHWLQ